MPSWDGKNTGQMLLSASVSLTANFRAAMVTQADPAHS